MRYAHRPPLSVIRLEDRINPGPLALTINPAQSSLTLAGSVTYSGVTLNVDQQVPGSLTSPVGGNLTIDLDPASDTVRIPLADTTLDLVAGTQARPAAVPAPQLVATAIQRNTPSSGVVTVTTATDHGYSVGQRVQISGVPNGGFLNLENGYNNVWVVTQVVSSTQFRYSASPSYNANVANARAQRVADLADYGGKVENLFLGSAQVAVRDLIMGLNSGAKPLSGAGPARTFTSDQLAVVKSGTAYYGDGTGTIGGLVGSGTQTLTLLSATNTSSTASTLTETGPNTYSLTVPIAISLQLDISGTPITLNLTGQIVATGTLTPNAKPVVTSNGGGLTAAVTIPENTTAVTTVAASDADAQTPAFSIVGGRDAAKFAINPTTGALSFLTAPDADTGGSAAGDNVYVVVVRAADGVKFGTDDQTVLVTVSDVNEAPVAGDRNYGTDQGQALTVPAATGLLQGVYDPESRTTGSYFFEDFEGLTYTGFPTAIDGGNRLADWSLDLPASWSRSVGASTPGPGSNAGANVYYGWRAFDIDSWISDQGDQGRTGFTRGGAGAGGKVWVVDSGAYDDFVDVDAAGAQMNAYATTGTVAIPAGVKPGTLAFSFDTDFRHAGAAGGRVEVSYDGGANWTTLQTLTADARNQHLSYTLTPGAATAATFRFAYENAGNDCFWAIDNPRLSGERDLGAALVLTHTDPANGGADVDEATGAFEYTPAGSYSGTDTFSYTVSDGVNPSTRTVSVVVAPVVPAPAVTGVTVNATGNAPSASFTYSRVTSLVVTLNTAVSSNPADLGAGAFTLTRGTTTLTNGSGISVTGYGTTTLTLTFTGAAGVVDFGSLADGVWTLTTDHSLIRNAAGVAGAGTTTTNHIRRLFGDGNGDGLVNLVDFGLFGGTFGKGSAAAGFNPAFNWNGDGQIDLVDFGAFGQRFGKGL